MESHENTPCCTCSWRDPRFLSLICVWVSVCACVCWRVCWIRVHMIEMVGSIHDLILTNCDSLQNRCTCNPLEMLLLITPCHLETKTNPTTTLCLSKPWEIVNGGKWGILCHSDMFVSRTGHIYSEDNVDTKRPQCGLKYSRDLANLPACDACFSGVGRQWLALENGVEKLQKMNNREYILILSVSGQSSACSSACTQNSCSMIFARRCTIGAGWTCVSVSTDHNGQSVISIIWKS